MRRCLPLAASLLVLGAACGGRSVGISPSAESPASSTPSSSPPATIASPHSMPTESPSALALPKGLPPSFDGRLPAQDVPPEALVPREATVTGVWDVRSRGGVDAQIVVAWTAGEDPFAAEQGLAIWQAFPEDPPWRAVFAFTDPPARGVLGIRAELGDLTGDEHEDVLSIESTGGSGDCATWRVLATEGGSTRELYHHKACDTQVAVSDGTLVLTESVFEPGDAHCCPSAVRETTLRWDGAGWQIVDETVTQH